MSHNKPPFISISALEIIKKLIVEPLFILLEENDKNDDIERIRRRKRVPLPATQWGHPLKKLSKLWWLSMSLRTILPVLPLLFILIACSTTPPASELMDGHLRPCPKRPNCTTSDSGISSSIAPISFHGSPEKAWQQMKILIQELGGEIDDVELRMESQENLIHIRSGARVGYSDFGVNRKRIEKIQQLFSEQSAEKLNL
ncbi:MAG: DUF1499 domain-containing protein [Desulfobulbaceae bacterium]|nr:DUF1499 domain-containing protein [Desulfobulbaceae bacterium]